MLSATPTPREIFEGRFFEEPLVPIGAKPTAAENAALVAALRDYSRRTGPDDFSGLTGFLDAHPDSPWTAALLTNLGLECYKSGHYSKALEAWRRAWELAKETTDPKGKPLADRAVGELASMYARLGRMIELDDLLKSAESRVFSGPATERIVGAREGLWSMRNQPEISFRCGSLALHRIKISLDPDNPGTDLIHATPSTQQGFSLSQLAELSQRLGLYFQMAYREKGAAFIVPSVVHWSVGHYAAINRQEGDRYLCQDPTFGNDVWVTRTALEAEASGYFLVPPGDLGTGWRAVSTQEGDTVWGKGNVCCLDPGPHGPCDPASGGGACGGDGGGGGGGGNGGNGGGPSQGGDSQGMAVSRVHLLLVSLNINDDPVGYMPPVGPPVRFMVRYNQRDAFQPANFTYSNLGPKWTFDWLSYVTDNPLSPLADVTYYIVGGGTRTFTGFDSHSQSFAFQQYDQTRLTRTSPTSYEMLSRDGTRKIFGQSDGAIGASRKIFLTQIIDPFDNTVSLTYDGNLRITTITDAIGQVTKISYEHPTDIFKITKVTDPFGRFATFEYDSSPNPRLTNITDVIGITSQFTYDGASDFITRLTTPYGDTTFTKVDPTTSSTVRALESLYPDGERERVEFNQTTSTPPSDPPQSVPGGMATKNDFLNFRNTFYWDKQACAFGFGDFTKARLYHWLHTINISTASGILESSKAPLEGRVWYDYAGQSSGDVGSLIVGSTNRPKHIGRVLDDGSTQLYTYEYNDFGNVTKTIDPVGRTFSYIYNDNGIDLREVRQTRAGQNELLSQTTYNNQHLPLTRKDAAGQTTTYAYNVRGQPLTQTNALGDTTTYDYDTNGNRTSVVDPLGGKTTFTYDAMGRVRTNTDVSGYTLTFDYDALDRLTKITFPDSTVDEFTYTLLDRTLMRDRAGRQTSFEYNSVRQMTKRTDPLNRITYFQWCKCGSLKTLTDPMGRTTTWRHDVQGRVKCKEYADGSKVTYLYENNTSRLRQKIDEKFQVTQYSYNRDDTLSGKSYTNAAVATPAVTFTCDSNYSRVTSMTDGTGKTRYGYIPVTPTPMLGVGKPASVDGPLSNDTITYVYDALGRRVSTAINGVAATLTFDAIGRVTSATNALGIFNYTYDGNSIRRVSQRYPNGQKTEYQYGSIVQDKLLQQTTNSGGGVLTSDNISEFIYGHDVPTGQITTWSQRAGTQTPAIYSLGYDAVDQLTSATVSQGARVLNTFIYSYDPAGNRLIEQIDATTTHFFYNALNELTSSDSIGGDAATYEWDAERRLTSITSGNKNTQFTYDGLGRCVGIRQLVAGSEVSDRRFVWCDNATCQERAPSGVVAKRFFEQGIQLEDGPTNGLFSYTRDHLGSIREVTDNAGNVRARYSYDLFGRGTRLVGDVEADFGFAGMFRLSDFNLHFTKYRLYDPQLARWSSRDPVNNAELLQGPNLFAYVGNNPVNLTDPFGLQPRPPVGSPLECCFPETENVFAAILGVAVACGSLVRPTTLGGVACVAALLALDAARRQLAECQAKNCAEPPPERPPDPPDPCVPISAYDEPTPPCYPDPICPVPDPEPIPASFAPIPASF